MSRAAKISFLVAFLLLLSSVVLQIMTEQWINLNTVLVSGAVLMVMIAIGVDHKLYLDFLTMRTTKHGMNMGAMIFMVFLLVVCVNFLGSRYGKSWDLTQERLNSLSDQSVTIAKGLTEDAEFKIFARGNQAQEEKNKVRSSLQMFQDVSPKIKARYINPYVDNALAMEYLNDLPDRDSAPTVVFVEHKGRRIRVDPPFDESALAGALIKATREGKAKIYFMRGHGEKDPMSGGDQSLRELARTLVESSFEVEPLSLIDTKQIPADASVVAIVGPAMPYLDAELELIRGYLRSGGKMLIALDPGQRHNLAGLTKSLGVQFENNFVATLAPIQGGGPAMVLGREFDPSSEITKSFPPGQSFSLFYLASEVNPASDKPESIQAKTIVKSDANSFTVTDIRQTVTERPATKPISVAVEVKGTLAGDPKSKSPGETKPFEAVIFGDSDFLSDRSYLVGSNKDLALNAFAQLAEQKDLISIRPKVPKGTMLMMTNINRWAMVIMTLSIPLLLLTTSGIVWFRRRGA